MADDIVWFIFRRETHALDMSKKGIKTCCGLMPLPSAEFEFETLADGVWPEGVCPRCLVIIGSEQVEEEPLESALRRGYMAGRDVKGLTPLP
jgi:hypothetical protein